MELASDNQGKVGKSADDFAKLRVEAEGGNLPAQLELARAYDSETSGHKDERLATMWYRRAADQGNSEAQDALGDRYLVGRGLKKSMAEAVNWFRKSARQGNSSAMYHLGAVYFNGDGVQIDYALSYAWFRLAQEAGDNRAAEAVTRAESVSKPGTITSGLEKIAEMYESGQALPENPAEAKRWWAMAAARGDEDAEVGVAFNTLRTHAAPQGLKQARQICSNAAAKHHDHRAEYCMGYIYEHGSGVAPNAKKARNWYALAASKGQSEAMRSLASMEMTGEGGKVDRVAAFLLYAQLLEMQDKDAMSHLTRLRRKITAKEWGSLQKPLLNIRIDPSKLDHILQEAAGLTPD